MLSEALREFNRIERGGLLADSAAFASLALSGFFKRLLVVL
jgi:hypothetical protein